MTNPTIGAAIAVSKRTSCRLCGGGDLELALPLAPTAPADAYVPAAALDRLQQTFPLDLYLCQTCGHAQLLDVVDPNVLFGDYIYRTSSSPGLVEHFRRYAHEVLGRVGSLEETDLVVDIGSNDGTLLRFFKEQGARVQGVDAAAEIAREATESGVPTISRFFTSALGRQLRADLGPARIVTANNVFAHADNLGDIADGIQALLAPHGVFVFEVSYLADLVQGLVFDYIYHEHLCYHSVQPLQSFLSQHGLELIDVQRIPTKGGSLRCTAQLHAGPCAVSPSVTELIALEDRLGVHRTATYTAFAREIEDAKTKLITLLKDLTARGKIVAGYGASATVTTLVYHFDLGPFLSFIVDDNATRQGLFSPGLHIPVLSPATLYERKPDYVVVLAWRFADLILKQHQAFLAQGGHFIVPLPHLIVV